LGVFNALFFNFEIGIIMKFIVSSAPGLYRHHFEIGDILIRRYDLGKEVYQCIQGSKPGVCQSLRRNERIIKCGLDFIQKRNK
jgi:hypothetical protein